MPFEFREKTIQQLKQNFSERARENKNGFADFDDFLAWYNAQEKICHCCKLAERESQEIVMTGILTSNRFPQNGVIGRGQSRGVWLEVDRLKLKEKYSRENCVMCYYFCNNDKSDVFEREDYFKFRQNRIKFLKDKLRNAN